MKASLRLEVIGWNVDFLLREHPAAYERMWQRPGGIRVLATRQRYWVAEIVGSHPRFGWERRFLKPQIDFTDAVDGGQRGVMACYLLECGQAYEVQARLSWERVDRYCCIPDVDGTLRRVGREEVDEWLRTHGVSPSASTS